MIQDLCQRLLLFALRIYQLAISPLLPPACRFEPTCSSYAVQAVRLHGPFKGSWLAIRRLGRCHPFHPGGYDPVPETMPRLRGEERRSAEWRWPRGEGAPDAPHSLKALTEEHP